jgi:HAE1 family hydrophobic/amphiphilic exporter-1
MLVLVFGLLFPLWGQEKPAPATILTLEEVLKIAADQNRDIQRAKEYRNQVLGKIMEEKSAALPQLSLSGTVVRRYDDTYSQVFKGIDFGSSSDSSSGNSGIIDAIFPSTTDNRLLDVRLSQPIYTFGKIGAAIRAAKLGVPFARDQLRIFQQAVARDVSTEFYNILYARQLHQLALENQAQKQRHLDEAQRKYAAGLATDYDVLAARVDLENARPSVIRSALGIETAKERLRLLLVMDQKDYEVRGSMESTVDPYPGFEGTFSSALLNRPEVSDISTRLEGYKLLVKIVEGDGKPRIDFNGSLGLNNLSIGPLAGTGKTWSAAVTLSVPIFDGNRTKGRAMQAQTEVTRAEIDQAKLRDSIALEVRQTVNSVLEAGEILKALGGTVEQAERLLYMAEKGFEYGAKTRIDVDDAQTNLMQAKVNQARAQRDYKVALVALEWVKGTL